MKRALFALLMMTASIGCLEKDTTQTVYIERDGSVTWEVLERDVYSSAAKPEDRLREENEYLRRAVAGRPDIVEGLTDLGGTDVRSELLRDRRPFSLRATARFEDLEHALRGLFEAAEIAAEVRQESDGDRRILTITPLDIEPLEADEGPVCELFRSDEFRLVLAQGTFDEAEGFSIEDQGRVAVWPDDNAADIERLRLVWTVTD